MDRRQHGRRFGRVRLAERVGRGWRYWVDWADGMPGLYMGADLQKSNR
jgi:hypothetical protein